MGIFSGAKAQLDAQMATRTHIAGNKASSEGRPEEASEKYAQALRLYQRAMGDKGLKPAFYQGYAMLLMRLGDFDQAKKIMEDIHLMKKLTDDDWFDLRFNYSICLWKEGRLDDAIATLNRAAQIKKNAAVYTTMGMFEVDKAKLTGEFDAAEAANRQGLDYDDEDAGVLDNVAALYEARMEKARADGDEAAALEYRRKAKEYYAKAHAIKPRQITTTYALAKLCHEDGEDAKAREALEDADNLYFSALCPVTKAMMAALKRTVG